MSGVPAAGTPREAAPAPRGSAAAREWRRFALYASVFVAAWLLPLERLTLAPALEGPLAMAHDYARHHVLLCLVPALFIAGAIGAFVSQAAVMRYLGPATPPAVAYPAAAVSGTVLAACSCTVLPLFSGIHRRGAGLGPAIAFLYAGPAINVLAIILTARVLGFELGIARAMMSILFAVLIGLSMHLLFRRSEHERAAGVLEIPPMPAPSRSLPQTAITFALLVGILVFANWARPVDGPRDAWMAVYRAKWIVIGALAAALAFVLLRWFDGDELSEWVVGTWDFARQILPLLLVGVLAAGLLFGRPGHGGLIPTRWITQAVSGNSIAANFVAAFVGAFMYFATLTEVPILQGLIGSGMGRGPALALLLAGPALSLPSMLVIRGILGTRRTVAFIALVIAFSTLAGLLFGLLADAR